MVSLECDGGGAGGGGGGSVFGDFDIRRGSWTALTCVRCACAYKIVVHTRTRRVRKVDRLRWNTKNDQNYHTQRPSIFVFDFLIEKIIKFFLKLIYILRRKWIPMHVNS